MMHSLEDRLQDAMVTLREVALAEETVAQCWDEAQPLFERHWQEIAEHADIPLSIDRVLYMAAEAAGQLCILTARVDHRLVGYAVFFIRTHPHYMTSLHALEDIIYIHPGLRRVGVGAELLAFSENVLRAKGCQIVHHHVKNAHPELGYLLRRQGYTQVETIYGKRLDGVQWPSQG